MDKIVVGFYVNSNVCKNIDLTHVLEGNPGIGGTEFTTIVLATLLADDNYLVKIYSEEIIDKLPKNIINIVSNRKDCLSQFDKDGGGIFIYYPKSLDEMDYCTLKNTKIIIWNHLDNLERNMNKVISDSNAIAANVFLTDEQSFRYCVFPNLLKKSTVIGHFANPISKVCISKDRIKSHNVTFIGHISPAKSLDGLVTVWPKVAKKVPDAKLYVCGSATLYNKNAKLGVHGIAEESYEKKIFKSLNTQELVDSVIFLGTLSSEQRQEIIKDTKVGVVNPSKRGLPETFCLSALDFGSYAVPVVGGDFGGLVNTIPNECGVRVKSKRALYNAVVSLLLDDKKNYDYGMNYYNYISNNYSLESFRSQWVCLIENISNEIKNKPIKVPLKKKLYYRIQYLLLRCKAILRLF